MIPTSVASKQSAEVDPGATEFRVSDLRIEDWIGIFVLLTIMGSMSAGVFFRYVLNDSLSWSEELARYGLIYVTFIGAATGIRRGTHVRVDLVDLVLKGRTKALLRLLMDILCIFFLAYTCWRTTQIMGFLGSSRSPAMQIPVNWIYGGILAGLMAAVARQLLIISKSLRGLMS